MTVRASLVVAANPETDALARRLGATGVVSMPDVGVPDDYAPPAVPQRPGGGVTRILWVGRLAPRKAVVLALDAMALMPADAEAELVVVGGGAESEVASATIAERGLRGRVKLRGPLLWSDVRAEYRDADIFLFTSLRDSGGVPLAEAMAWGLPIVTLDHQGAASFVPADAGIRVPVTDPGTSVRELSAALVDLCASPDLRKQMGEAARLAAGAFTWSEKAKDMTGFYAKAADHRRGIRR